MFALKPQAHVLAVRDLTTSAAYFRDALGFSTEWVDGDDWQALVRDEVRVLLGRCPDAPPASAIGDHAYFASLATSDVDALHRELVARGALIFSAPIDRGRGRREMVVGTPDGHRMTFAQTRR